MSESKSESKSKTSSSDTSSGKALFTQRPNHGIDGRSIQIVSNHFPLKFTSDLLVYHYDIDMEPMYLNEGMARMSITGDSDEKSAKKRFRKINNKINGIVVEEAVKRYSETDGLFDGVLPVYDGQRNLYTSKALPIEKHSLSVGTAGQESKPMARLTVEVNEDGRSVKYAINLKLASIIDMNNLKRYFNSKTNTVPSDALQVLNIILRHGPSMNKIPIGNSLYAPYNESAGLRQPIGGGRQLAYGYFQSVRPEFNGVSLVIDRTVTALYGSGALVRFIADILNLNRDQFMALKGFTDSERRRVEKELLGVMIQVKHLTYKRKYKVLGLTKEPAHMVQFEVIKTDGRGKEINLGVKSVIDFYKESYPNLELKWTHLPCVKVGNPKKPGFLPISICELVPDQHVSKNLTNEQMVQMIRSSASQLPKDRLKFIEESAKGTLRDSKAYMKEFGISFKATDKPLQIEARVLNPPVLMYGSGVPFKPFDGKWDIRNQRFFVPASLEHWIIIDLSTRGTQKQAILENMMKDAGQRLGMRISDATKRVTIKEYGPQTINSVFKKALEVTNGKLQLIVFVIALKYQYLYETIKKVGDVDFGIVTQCIKETNLDNLRQPLIQNLMLKVNTKLGGINAVLDGIPILKRDTMVVGVDCSHPGVGDKMSKSVSACVASIDNSFVRYFATTRVQKKAQEISSELHAMMLDLIREWSERNKGLLPEHIIIYRDGVSEGQFNTALQQEIIGLAKAFAAERVGYVPKLTYIVVQKRHHTRFFPYNPSDGVGRAKNVPPGLVVDTDVISKTHFDYFLCSHEGIQGTSRPTHYFILRDDNEMTADQLQSLTFSLTHVYARCTRSISYPAPVAYAHLAAYRAQRHIIGNEVMAHPYGDQDSGSYSSRGMAEPRRHRASNATPNPLTVNYEMQSQMYFC